MHNFRDYAMVFVKGLAMGAADVVPGVSGGTIAFITGIYERWIEALSRFNLTAWRLLREEGFAALWRYIHGGFLLALLAGILCAILTLAQSVRWLLEHHPVPLWAFFFGLVAACIWFLRREVRSWHTATYIAAAIGALLAVIVSLLPQADAAAHGLPFIFFAAALAICAMILPGISGAFVLVLLGAYKPVLDALHARDWAVLFTFAAGAVIGLLSFARVLQWLFARYHDLTVALLTGFIAGSLVKIWPWQQGGRHLMPWQMADAPNGAAFACLAGGFALVFALETLAAAIRRRAA